jgi:Fe2+ or Zn2+ uptake regulation protein
MDAHYHVRCQETGQIIDLPTPFDPQLLDKLDPQLGETLRRQGFQVAGYRLEVLGVPARRLGVIEEQVAAERGKGNRRENKMSRR